MGMGMSVSPQIWQQFVDLVFQDDLIKCKQNFDIIMDDTFIHKKAKKFKWTDEAKTAFNKIKKLLISPPVLKAPTPDGLF